METALERMEKCCDQAIMPLLSAALRKSLEAARGGGRGRDTSDSCSKLWPDAFSRPPFSALIQQRRAGAWTTARLYIAGLLRQLGLSESESASHYFGRPKLAMRRATDSDGDFVLLLAFERDIEARAWWTATADGNWRMTKLSVRFPPRSDGYYNSNASFMFKQSAFDEALGTPLTVAADEPLEFSRSA